MASGGSVRPPERWAWLSHRAHSERQRSWLLSQWPGNSPPRALRAEADFQRGSGAKCHLMGIENNFFFLQEEVT